MLFASLLSKAQGSLEFHVTDSITGLPLFGVSVGIEGSSLGSITDANGNISFKELKNGNYEIAFVLISYKQKKVQISIPNRMPSPINIKLAPLQQNLNEVIISTTRTNSRIEDQPVKIEVIGTADLDDESSLEPETISSLLGDLAGINTQQTSQVNGNTEIKIQGLDGKYTKLLRDGLPLFEGFSGGFGILDLPPLDLKQVELIKGPASTLYGNGAVAGLVNLISKEPADSTQFTIDLNQTTLSETNLNAYYSKKGKVTGLSVFAGATHQLPADVNHDGYSDAPKNDNVFFHPRFFFYPKNKSQVRIGISYLNDRNMGGKMEDIGKEIPAVATFYSLDRSQRFTIDYAYTQNSDSKNQWNIKGSMSNVSRNTLFKDARMEVNQLLIYQELSRNFIFKKHTLVTGVNYNSSYYSLLSNHNQLYQEKGNSLIPGIFFQDHWTISQSIIIESGFRADLTDFTKVIPLPAISLLAHWNEHLSSRIGGALGYQLPENLPSQIWESGQTIIPVSHAKEERSAGCNGDFQYKSFFGNTSITLNQSFFYIRIQDPVVFVDSFPRVLILNEQGNITSMGTESYVRIERDPFEVYLGYVYTNSVNINSEKHIHSILVSPHKFAGTFVMEPGESWKFGFEGAYTSYQFLSDGRKAPGFWFGALMAQHHFRKFVFTLNCENLFDFKQSDYENLVDATTQPPRFKEVWGPTLGRNVNLSIRYSIR